MDNIADIIEPIGPTGTDVFSVEKRSKVMAAIRGNGNKSTELRMIELFRLNHITGWRRKVALFGKPDFTFQRERVVVFVDGCFWHSCPKPKHSTLPKSRAEWWAAKLARNRQRDRAVTRKLRRERWTVLRVWECDLVRDGVHVVRRISKALRAGRHARHAI